MPLRTESPCPPTHRPPQQCTAAYHFLVGTSGNEHRRVRHTDLPAARLCALEAADTGTERRLPCGSTDVMEQRADGLETRSNFDRGEPSTYGPRRPARASKIRALGLVPHTPPCPCADRAAIAVNGMQMSAGTGFEPWQTVGECRPPSRNRLWQPGGRAYNEYVDGLMPSLRCPSTPCVVLRFCMSLLTDLQPDQLAPRLRRIS